MAQIHGKDAYISLNGSVLSGEGNNVTLNISVDTADATAFGDNWKVFLEGVAEWNISAEFFFDGANKKAADVAMDTIGKGPKVVIFYPGGSGATNVSYTGSAIITKCNKSAPVGGAVTLSMSLQGTGTLTKAGTV